MRQTVCLVCNPVMVDDRALLFNCMTMRLASDSMTVQTLIFLLLGRCLMMCLWSGPLGLTSFSPKHRLSVLFWPCALISVSLQ